MKFFFFQKERKQVKKLMEQLMLQLFGCLKMMKNRKDRIAGGRIMDTCLSESQKQHVALYIRVHGVPTRPCFLCVGEFTSNAHLLAHDSLNHFIRPTMKHQFSRTRACPIWLLRHYVLISTRVTTTFQSSKLQQTTKNKKTKTNQKLKKK